MTPALQSLVGARLRESGVAHRALRLGPRATLLASSLGGRVFGPFVDGVDESGWLPDAFEEGAAARVLLRSGDWNLGGERLWLSPELGWFVADRDRFWDSYAVPPALDPALYELAGAPDEIVLRLGLSLRGRRARILRRIVPLPPLLVPDGLTAVGFRQVTRVVLEGEGDPPAIPWAIRQIALGGAFAAPAREGAASVPIVGGPPLRAGRCGFFSQVTAERLVKHGFLARDLHGRLTSLHDAAGRARLTLLDHPAEVSGPYFEEPPERPGVNGMSDFLFIDDGRFGGYAELEVTGTEPPEWRRPGLRVGRLVLDTHVVVGSSERLMRLPEWPGIRHQSVGAPQEGEG